MRRQIVVATNSATASTNKIHDDGVARGLGYEAGLVPGASVYAYLVRAFVDRWGEPWLHHGSAAVGFVNPAYHGEQLCVSAADRGEIRAAYAVTVSGRACAAARAWLPAASAAAVTVPRGGTAIRLPVEEVCASPGIVLSPLPVLLDDEGASAYLASVDETDARLRERRFAHPGWLVQCANEVLKANVELGPWIHTASRIASHRAALVGEPLEVRARASRAWVVRDQRFLELDVVVLDEREQAVQTIVHTAIVQPALIAHRT